MERIHTLITLTHNKWSLPIIGQLYSTDGGRFVTLMRKLDIFSDSLTRTLQLLVDHEWIAHNPGYGHPLRPEYILTERGKAIAPQCHHLWEKAKRMDITEVAQRKWTYPVIYMLCDGCYRFSHIQATLSPVTAKALAQVLKELENGELIERDVSAAYPPQVTYQLTIMGQQLCPSLHNLVEAIAAFT
jgi:DNA-binding HxlR family transcriptional regulator